jgi:hypothetical protein
MSEVKDKQKLPTAVKKVIRRRVKDKFGKRTIKIKKPRGRPKKDSLRFILAEIEKILVESSKNKQ